MPTALGIVLVLAAVVAFFAYAARAGARMEAERKERLRRARKAKARIVAASRGSSALRRNGGRAPEIVLLLDLEGRRTKARWHVFELGLAKVQEGNVVDVLVDADDPRVVYPGADWAELSFLGQRAA